MASHMRQCFRMKKSLCRLPNALKLTPVYNANSQHFVCAGIGFDASIISREIEFQNEEFNAEKKRQIESVGRIEKIVVDVIGPPQDVVLYMNQHISTPYDCGLHTTEGVVNRAALALLDSKTLWDMHRPLTGSCHLKFLYFDDEDPQAANDVFWESCSFILGAVIANAFKDNLNVTLHSYPPPDYRIGSFAYDAQLSLEKWTPNYNELRILSSELTKFCAEGHHFERLDVSKEIALTMFEGNPYKEKQIEETASSRKDNTVTLYRIGKHIDISNGPLMSHTNLVNTCSVTAVHQIKTSAGPFYRFQGVALPKPLMLSHFAYGLLENRARKLNKGRFPEGGKKVLPPS